METTKIKNRLVKCVYYKLLGYLADANPRLGSCLIYFAAFHRVLNLNHPVDFNQKIMWLKLNSYYDNDLVTMCADKLRLREFVKKAAGSEDYLPKIYGSWEFAEDIEWSALPEKFVLKCNHGCGYNIICRDRKSFNCKEAFSQLNAWIKEDYYKLYVETVYKFIPKRILCEEYLEDGLNHAFLTDYKFYCFSGIPIVVLVCENRTDDAVKLTWFDMDWNILDIAAFETESSAEKPRCFEEMCDICRLLSKPFPFVRVDLYVINERPYIGEMTFTPYAGVAKYYNQRGLIELGRYIRLGDVGS